MYKYKYTSPFGIIVIIGCEEYITGLYLQEENKYSGDIPLGLTPAISLAIEWLDIYFKGIAPNFTPPIKLEGTAFRQEVWQILTSIKYGETMTYGEIGNIIAKKRGIKKMSPQAVGGAVGHNPVALIVPCHRVIGGDGSLVGYRYGVELKKRLLDMEGIAL